MPTPDMVFHMITLGLALVMLMISPYMPFYFGKKCLDSANNAMALVYFGVTIFWFLIYVELGRVALQFVSLHI